MTDYQRAIAIVKERNYTKANKKFLYQFVMEIFPESLVLEEVNCYIELNLRNQLVITYMNNDLATTIKAI